MRRKAVALLDEYYEMHEAPPEDVAKRILFAVFDDLHGRSGLDWDDVDIDDGVKEEILQTNLEKVREHLPG